MRLKEKSCRLALNESLYCIVFEQASTGIFLGGDTGIALPEGQNSLTPMTGFIYGRSNAELLSVASY